MPYAMSVIVSRAIPEIDGFKPSHRKLLYTMYDMGPVSYTHLMCIRDRYEITCKEKTWFVYSDKEKTDIVAGLEGKKLSLIHI